MSVRGRECGKTVLVQVDVERQVDTLICKKKKKANTHTYTQKRRRSYVLCVEKSRVGKHMAACM